MQNYELMMILDTKLSPDDVSVYTEQFTELITTLGGNIIETNKWGKKRLAYPINKHTEGVYLVLNLNIPGGTVAELRKTLKSSEEIIRFILLKTN